MFLKLIFIPFIIYFHLFILKTSEQIPVKKTLVNDTLNQKIFNQLVLQKKWAELGEIISKNLKNNPKNENYLTFHKQWITLDYQTNFKINLIVEEKEMFSIQPQIQKCLEGKISPLANKKALNFLNYCRRLTGLYDSCFFDEEDNKIAQKTAFLMEANNSLSHSPPQSWTCFNQTAFNGAGKSNLSLGYGFSESMLGQIEDDGSHNSACGHRRWILNPYNRVFGYGSTEKAMALKVIETNKKRNAEIKFNDKSFIAWPSANYFPIDLIFERWSFSIENANFALATVTIMQDKIKIPVQLEKVKTGFALNTIVWKLKSQIQVNKVYKVQINNIKFPGNPLPITYQYDVIPVKIISTK